MVASWPVSVLFAILFVVTTTRSGDGFEDYLINYATTPGNHHFPLLCKLLLNINLNISFQGFTNIFSCPQNHHEIEI